MARWDDPLIDPYEVERLWTDVRCHDDDEELSIAEQIVYDACQSLWNIGFRVKSLIPIPDPQVVPIVNNNTTRKIRFPKSELPSFDGKQENWMSFRYLFTAAIINQTIADSQRLYYLQLAAKGEASVLVKDFQLTDGNFKEAWDTLVCRY